MGEEAYPEVTFIGIGERKERGQTQFEKMTSHARIGACSGKRQGKLNKLRRLRFRHTQCQSQKKVPFFVFLFFKNAKMRERESRGLVKGDLLTCVFVGARPRDGASRGLPHTLVRT